MIAYLIQARNPADIARSEEVECFARQIGCSLNEIQTVNIATETIELSCFGAAVAVLFGAYAGEFAYAKANKIESGSKFINPNDIPELQNVPEPTAQTEPEA